MGARALGIDLGERRIGVAVSDSDGRVATPLTVIKRSGSRHQDHRKIAELVEEYEAGVVVVGLPLSLDGGTGPAAIGAQDEAQQLESAVKVPVLTHDERLTTVIAEQSLAESGLSGKARRRRVDMVAASVILQGWLDASNSESKP
ncbi:MAG: Holliday junction resolvase RuvX [Acidimicrobiia bacterium]|nr:Holliday junction resolvase RuvX [Acidimicrobiia bacterium]MXZ85486.1 Holliday junction resolvase RuvX [Acidimicrobiia bacterium]MYE71902.1 Holliday junction resolvase RuvX [Acidimicrobiia bacterium]MYG71453.1 Holliday junction resolvase RuvX [Acidimicrobiia bacterium]MYJ63300.1 Holliday junction resolvase RuvX [Acidimicrobiia bacterium]